MSDDRVRGHAWQLDLWNLPVILKEEDSVHIQYEWCASLPGGFIDVAFASARLSMVRGLRGVLGGTRMVYC